MAIDVYKEWLGIPDGPRPPDHYQLLRLVQFEDDAEKVRKHYKKLNAHVRKYASGQYSNESQTLLNELAKAMLLLTDEERKREYDRDLGREIDDRDPSTGRRPLTSHLVDEGVISSEQVREIENYAARVGLSNRDAAVQLKLATPDQAARALANEKGLPYIDLTEVLPDDSVLDNLPRATVRRHTCLPLFAEDDAILIACADEPDQELEDEVRLRFGKPLRPVLPTPLMINQCISKYYAAGLRQDPGEAPAKVKGKPAAKAGGKSSASVAKPKSSSPAVKLTDDERAEQQKMGYILMCWAFVVPSALDTWVLYDRVYAAWGFVPSSFPFVLTILATPILLGLIYLKYFK